MKNKFELTHWQVDYEGYEQKTRLFITLTRTGAMGFDTEKFVKELYNQINNINKANIIADKICNLYIRLIKIFKYNKEK